MIKGSITLHCGMLLRCALLLVLMMGVMGAKAADYVIAYTNNGTTYYVGMNGTTLQAKTELDATCVWQGYYNGDYSLSTTTRINIQNKNNTNYYLYYGNDAITASTSNQRRWYGGDGSSIYYYNGGTYRYIHNSGSTITTSNSATNAFIPYSVTTSSVAASLTNVTLSGDETLSTTGGHDYSVSGTYTSATTNYRFNNADHYVPAQTTETVTPTGTWTVSGTGASYVSVDENTGTITVNSLPSDGDKTITLRCVPSYNGTTGTAATKTVTLLRPVPPTAISTTDLTLNAGATQSLAYTLTPSAAYHNVTATSSNTGIFTVTANNDGTVSITGVAAGTATLTLSALNASGGTACSTTASINVRQVCSQPEISFAPSAQGETAMVTLTTSTPGADIYYVTGDGTPSEASTKYTAPFEVPAGTRVRAVSIMTDDMAHWINSDVADETYVQCVLPKPSITISGNMATFASTVEGVTIWYTYHSTSSSPQTPTGDKTWTPGDPAVSIPAGNVVTAIAVKNGCRNSDMAVQVNSGEDFSEQTIAFLYRDGSGKVHILTNTNGVVSDSYTFDPDKVIWTGTPWSNPDDGYDPYITLQNNGQYLYVYDDSRPSSEPVMARTDIVNELYYARGTYTANGLGDFIMVAYNNGPYGYSMLRYNNGWIAQHRVGQLYVNPSDGFALGYPVVQHSGSDYALNVVYPSGYETTKELVSKGGSVTIDASTSGDYIPVYYEVGYRKSASQYTYLHYYYYPGSDEPMTTEPTAADEIRITYELLNATDFCEVTGNTITLLRDPSRDLLVSVRIVATPYKDGVALEDGIKTAEYQFYILTSPPFPAPVISRVEGTNDYQMTCTAANCVIEYRINGEATGGTPSPYHDGWLLYEGPITITTPETIITARSYRDSDKETSDPVNYNVGGTMLLSPDIAIADNGTVTITANSGNSSLPGYSNETILYTTNGSLPDPANYGGDNPTQVYSGSFSVDNGQTVTALAIATGFANSAPNEATYKVASSVAVAEGVITLNDYEDHKWSYYQASADLPDGYPDVLHSPYPRNVQITYFGYGDNTMSTADAAAPAADTFNKNTSPVDVQVGIGEAGHTFLYHKTLERDANGRFPYELIPNPFYVRPDYRSGTESTHTIKVTMNDAGGNGWNGQLLADFSDGTATKVLRVASGSTATETFDVSAGVKVRLTWIEGSDNAEASFTVRYYDGNTDGDVILTRSAGSLSTSEVLHHFTVKGMNDVLYTGFYKWRVKKIEGGSIYSASSGGTELATTETDSEDNVMLDAETTYYFVPSDAGETNANNATSMKVELEALWALAEVTSSGTFSKGYNSVERNFYIGRSGTGTDILTGSTPCTFSSFYPNGTTDGSTTATLSDRNTARGSGTAGADSKVEYVILSTGTSLTGAGYSLTIGRGVTGSGSAVCATNVYGRNSNATTAQDYRIRLESGSYTNFYLTGEGRTFSSTVKAKAVLGSDYDRAREDNSKLSVAAGEGEIYGGKTLTFSGAANRNNLTFDWNIKSGTFHSGILGNATGGTESIYLGSSQAGNGNLRYIGKRRIIVEGGNMAGIAGAMNNVSTDYGVNDGGWAVMMRIMGGTIRSSVYGAAAFAQAVGDRVIVMTGGTVNGWVAGGCNGTQTGSGGTVDGDTKIYVGGNAQVVHTSADPTIGTSKGGNVFGAGSGYSAAYAIGEVKNSNVAVADNAVISRGVYGGGNFGYVGTNGTTRMFVLGGTMGSVFGGANQRYGQTVYITMTGGLVKEGVYGGSNVSGNINNDVTMLINGGQVGTDADHPANIHGGGLGNQTRVLGSVNMTLGTAAGAAKYVTVYGDVYGGSAQGRTNGNNNRTAGAVTNVTLNAGKIYGSLYGGGLGTSTYPAYVYGPVQVTVNGGGVHATVNDGSGAVYGCNNVNGAPQSTVKVDIYGTDAPADGRSFALDAVYGGGNAAAYDGTPEVKIHNCDNSIEEVYGGGNAAAVSGTSVTVYGANSIGAVYGGGHGDRFATPEKIAPVNGDVSVTIYGGTIGKVYGASNSRGPVSGDITVTVNKQTEEGHNACAIMIGELYSGGNMAASAAGTINIGCTGDYVEPAEGERIGYDVEGIGDVYGGANSANITGDIELNITGGIINRVFGANNNSGSIDGTITINVDKNKTCGWYIGDIFGGGNQAAYTAPAGKKDYPLINLTNGDVSGDVYGGGYGDPIDKTKGAVDGNPHIYVQGTTVGGNVFGGGKMANLTGGVDIEVTAGGVQGDIYGGGALADTNTEGGNTVINLLGGTVYNVFGGGLGDANTAAHVGGDVTVTLDGSAVTGTIFGCNNINGSPLGHVKVWVKKTVGWTGHDVSAGKADDSIAKTDQVYEVAAVYGGGNMAAYEPTNASSEYTEVLIDGCDLTSIGYVYGGGNAASVPATRVTVNGTYEIGNLFGGGNGKDDLPNGDPNPGADVGYLAGGTPYGAGTSKVVINGGTVHKAFGGSNTLGNVRTSATVNLDEDGSCPLEIDEVYGGGNEAYMAGGGNIVLGCISYLKEIYGGAKNANMGSDVSLTITSGHFDRVFGGNNIGGDINGSITVNIEETGCNPITIGELYGCGNQARYTTPGSKHPTINVRSFTSIGRIFGGGLGESAVVTGNPTVYIDEIKGAKASEAYAGRTITYTSGTERSVTLPTHESGKIGAIGVVYGGGNAAPVVGSTNVFIGTKAKVEYTSVSGHTADAEGVDIRGNVFGAGLGATAKVTGDTNVVVGK